MMTERLRVVSDGSIHNTRVYLGDVELPRVSAVRFEHEARATPIVSIDLHCPITDVTADGEMFTEVGNRRYKLVPVDGIAPPPENTAPGRGGEIVRTERSGTASPLSAGDVRF